MLESKRIYLRLMEEEDIEYKVSWINNPVINKTLNFDIPVSKVGTKQWLSKVSQNSNRKDFIVCLNENELPIGFGGLLNIDRVNSKAESYMTIGDDNFWGKGFSQEIRILLLEYAFQYLKLNKVYTYVWVENKKMINLNKSVGFKEEGILRQDIFSHGEFRDRMAMAIFMEDYMKLGE